jgi:hypothetical protein
VLDAVDGNLGRAVPEKIQLCETTDEGSTGLPLPVENRIVVTKSDDCQWDLEH